jgi:phage recombination protein Bet
MSELTPQQDRSIRYIPMGQDTEVVLSRDVVRKFLCTPTKSGQMPSDVEIVKFGMLCKARRLDPWQGDAFLVGYDGHDGPQFSLITSHQALLKRAESCPEYDGLESGIVVTTKDGKNVERRGLLAEDGDRLLGAWAIASRRDRSKPMYCSVKLSTYNTGRSRWKIDPEGMVVKVAEAAALRKMFPLEVGGLYSEEEMDRQNTITPDATVGGFHGHIEQARKQREPEAGEPQPEPTISLDECIALIRCATGIREVDQIEKDYRESNILNENDDIRLEAAASETKEQIRASRGTRSNHPTH